MEAELREAGAVTQGELLRQEQEAGVVPVATTSPRLLRSSTLAAAAPTAATQSGADLDKMDVDEDTVASVEDQPHARGPEEIGAEDIGNQTLDRGVGFDMEAATGRKLSPEPPHKEAEKEGSAVETDKHADEDWEKIEKDVEMGEASDADGKTERKESDSGTKGEAA